MFSVKQKTDLEAELHGLILRNFPDCRPCYRLALLHFEMDAFLIFDRYHDHFNLDAGHAPEDPLRDPADPDDDVLDDRLTGLLNSPLLAHPCAADPDPPPRLHRQTGRHREPPPYPFPEPPINEL